MLKIKYFAIVLLTTLCSASFSSSAIGKAATADELYQQAIIPWEQGRNSGWELMLKAADAGSVDAQCWIAKSSMESVWNQYGFGQKLHINTLKWQQARMACVACSLSQQSQRGALPLWEMVDCPMRKKMS